MSIFESYKKISYKIDDYDYVKAIDIRTTFKIKDILKNLGVNYYPYVIQNGERPDYVSWKIYNSPNYDWLIMLTNDIHNIYDDWPKDSITLDNYIADKYGSLSTALNTVKYYYDSKKNIIDLTTYNTLSSNQRSSETSYQYEVRMNTQKSIVKIIPKQFLGMIETQINTNKMKPVV